MTNVSDLLREDGKRQLITGIILLFCSLCTTLLFLLYARQWETGVLTVACAVVGGTVFSRGMHDRKLGKQTSLIMQKDKSIPVSRKVDRVMAIEGTLSSQTSIMSLDDKLFCTLKETGFPSSLFFHIVRFFMTPGSFLPKNFQLLDDQGNTLFYLQKRGGVSWRSYVFNENGDCVGYICPVKGEKGSVLQFIDESGQRWRAVKDYRDFFSITDIEGKTLLIMKPGAIPLEYAERFSKSDSVVVEWSETENIHYSLFLFLLAVLKSRSTD
ncbi:hypothetical protein [Virgibacillus senegalensis]|uniref:hypothetical protein n=1 Tax=Virgibacillus senegalensis TaxID=1499679 RepID=UPI00069F3601|nr:hypothetical protein [Virgibacillus senegalensis]